MRRFSGLRLQVAYPGTLGVVTDKGIQDVKPNVLDHTGDPREVVELRYATGVFEVGAPPPYEDEE